MTIRVLIADDHPIFRSGLRSALERADDVEVVDEVVDGEAAVQAARAGGVDVVLMDLHMPGTNGIVATRTITADETGPAVLVLTMFDDDESVFAAMKAGARGYLVKGASQERILDAVRSVAAGDLVFGSGVAERVLTFFAAHRGKGRSDGPFPTLTDREVEVLELIAAGRNNREIARELVLSDKTIRNNVSTIFAKLHVADRAQAIVRAREAGLGGGDTV